MKPCVVLFAAILLCLAPITRAETADDRYVEIYSWIEQGDALLKEGQTRLATDKYQEAQAALRALQKNHPGWNPKILSFRLDYVSGKLAQLGPDALSKPASALRTDKPAEAVVSPEAASGKLQEMQQQMAWLTKQNSVLEAKLKEALSVQPAIADPRELAMAEEKIKQLQKEKELLAVSLEQERAKNSKAAPAPTERSKQAEEKNKQLEAQLTAALASAKSAQATTKDALEERDDLAKKLEKTTRELDKANKDLRQRSEKSSNRNHKGVEKQLEVAQAKLAAYEAKAVPLTTEEQALVKQVEVKVAALPSPPNGSTNATSSRKKVSLPSGAGALFAEAERAIDSGRYAEAEKKLRDILRQDESNVRILFKLGAVLMDQDKSGEAETVLNKALSLDPEDPATLYLLGSLKLRQEKYDAALDLLSRSARAEPEMPQTQYFLGRVLIQKGQRAPAEAALRKAIQLKPGWGEPHYLLAVIYGTREPIYRELARFHYKKAIAGGATRNPELEARIENGTAAVKP
jgi:tetratricopeptide (TPR) repeat protein